MVMALPYLPYEHIQSGFDSIVRRFRKLEGSEVFEEFLEYVDATWLNSSTITHESLSVFKRGVRTNNHIEGWHRRLNGKLPQPHPNMYTLISLLYREALLSDINAKLVSEEKFSAKAGKGSLEVAMDMYGTHSKPSQYLHELVKFIPDMDISDE